MTAKDIKEEARRKLALNMHQAIIVYTVEFAIFITLVALVVMSCVSLGVNLIASVVMICYGTLLGLVAIVGIGMIGFSMTDFYLVTYRCRPYDIRRLGETLARSNITKVLLLSLKRTIIAFLLLLCLIVPGVIYIMRTSMAGYLLIANPQMKASAALTASNKVMSGKTGTYFALSMSLIGWNILGVLTLGLGFIFIRPYTNLIKAVYYKRAIQGDKAVYSQQQQPAPAARPAATPAAQPSAPTGPAPIDTLADEDVYDMNAAISDFGSADVVQTEPDVPEVPISVVTPSKLGNTESNEIPQQPIVSAVAEDDTESHVIDGTGIVETERVLSTQEIEYADDQRQKAIEHMYSNTAQDAPVINYLNGEGKSKSADFDDSFGSFDSAQPEPSVSDIDFDEFLRDFDNAVAEEQTENDIAVEPEPVNTEPVSTVESAPAQVKSAADRRREAEERIAASRAAAAQRVAQARSSGRSSDLADRTERLRREREERLKRGR